MQTRVERERQSGNKTADGLLALKDLDRQTQQILNAIPQHISISDDGGTLPYANRLRLTAQPNDGHGATFQILLPTQIEESE